MIQERDEHPDESSAGDKACGGARSFPAPCGAPSQDLHVLSNSETLQIPEFGDIYGGFIMLHQSSISSPFLPGG